MSVPLLERAVVGVSRAVGALCAPRSGLRILMYHSVGYDGLGSDVDAPLPTRVFKEQMRWLREESGLAVVPLLEGVMRLNDPARDPRAVAVTFDDGYLDTLTNAAPILDQYRIPFTAFVTGAFLDRPPVPRRYLDRDSLRELAHHDGAAIGAHGYTHRPLTRMPDQALADELHSSSDALADVTGRRPTSMSYPHGAVNGRVVAAVRDTDFQLAATSFVGVNGPRVSLLKRRRTEVRSGDTMRSFQGKVNGDYDWYRFKQRVYWPVPRAHWPVAEGARR